VTVEGIKAAYTAAESDDAKGEIGCAIKAASPNPRGPCGTHRTHRPTAGDGRGDCRWDDGAYQLIELVAVKWRTARTGNGDQIIAVFDGHDHAPIGVARSRIKNHGVRQRTGRQPI
jgi:hypothetical protein